MLSRTTAVLSAAPKRRGQRCSKVGLGGHLASLGDAARDGKPIKCVTRDNRVPGQVPLQEVSKANKASPD